MDAKAIVAAARQAMGPVGARIPNIGIKKLPTFETMRSATRRLEGVGFGAAWNSEVVGAKDAFVEMAVLLAATERMVFSSSIANMYARAAATTHGASAALADAFPGRFVLGLGAGYRFQAAQVEHEYVQPLARMRHYLAKMLEPQAISEMPEVPDVKYARLVAANGPKMLALAGELADGAIPTLVPAKFTAQARGILGPDKLLVIAMSVFPGDNEGKAKSEAKRFMTGLARFPGSPYVANLRRLGYSSDEISCASDRLVSEVLAYGDAGAIGAKVQKHLAAGADHVVLQTVSPDFAVALEQLIELASALTELGRK